MITLIFVIHFGRGALARPWLGLFIFVIADSIYTWLFESGLYAFSSAAVNIPSLIADSTYITAYLILSLGCLMQYLLVKYGSKAFQAPRQPSGLKV